MLVNLFKKESDDYARYWISVSTAVYDKKKKKQTDEYINATMPVRLVSDAADVFDECARKSKTKGIKYGRFEIGSAIFEAVHPKDEDYSYVRLVIFDMKDAAGEDD